MATDFAVQTSLKPLSAEYPKRVELARVHEICGRALSDAQLRDILAGGR